MTHDELREMYEFYSLGLLEASEHAEIEAHLKQGCESCKVGVRRAVITNSAILSFVSDVAPPKRLRRRVLASFGVERQNWGWMGAWGAVTAGLLVATLWYSTEVQRTHTDLALARQQVTKSASELTRVQTVLEFLNQPETKQVTFGKSEQQPPRGTVLVNPKSGVLLIASNLPALPAGKTFEMWIIPKGGAPKPAGLFQADPQGTAVHVARGAVDASTNAVAISVEPEAGSAAPSTTPIVVAPVAGL
jgi:anti-sigma-K factor RskA